MGSSFQFQQRPVRGGAQRQHALPQLVRFGLLARPRTGGGDDGWLAFALGMGMLAAGAGLRWRATVRR